MKQTAKTLIETYDILTENGRKLIMDNLEKGFISRLSQVIELCEDTRISVTGTQIVISTFDENKKNRFGGDVDITRIRHYNNKDCEIKMSLSSMGSFDLADKASYWKTIHAARILENWEEVTKLVDEFCQSWIDIMVFYELVV